MAALTSLCLTLLFTYGVIGEVFDNFDSCNKFFFKQTPVAGLNKALPTPVEPAKDLPNRETCLSAYNESSPAYICQRYGNMYYFATLYDRGRRIPLYSAYEMNMTNTEDITHTEDWTKGDIVNYESQLVHRNLSAQQMIILDIKREIKEYNKANGCEERYPQYQQLNKLTWSQAIDKDFPNFDRGHLNPAGHHSGDARKATMTHTNVAPQNPQFNKGPWNRYETKLKNNLTKGCSRMFVVTGVLPGNNSVGMDGKDRVNVPSHYWSAYCCTDNNDVPIRSGGALAPNVNGSNVTEYKSVVELQNIHLFGNNVHIFSSNCTASSSGSHFKTWTEFMGSIILVSVVNFMQII